MQYASINGLRSTAQPGLKGFCEHCGGAVQAKCGSIVLWHWAHLNLENCDSWHEPETLWHRAWKDAFGSRYSEVRIVKEGIYHIADVVSKEGIVFEFQNSSISAQEIAAREVFYGERMIWVVNGEAFKDHFVIYDDEFINGWYVSILDEFEAAVNYIQFRGGLIVENWRVKHESVKQILKRLGFLDLPEDGVYYKPQVGDNKRKAIEQYIFEEVFVLYEQQKQLKKSSKGNFSWARPRRSWAEAKRSIFIDFGGDDLYMITEGMGKEQGTGTRINKKRFLKKYRA